MGNERFLRDRDIAERYGISRATVWRWVRIGLMPPPVRLGLAAARWRASDVEQWEAARAAEPVVEAVG